MHTSVSNPYNSICAPITSSRRLRNNIHITSLVDQFLKCIHETVGPFYFSAVLANESIYLRLLPLLFSVRPVAVYVSISIYTNICTQIAVAGHLIPPGFILIKINFIFIVIRFMQPERQFRHIMHIRWGQKCIVALQQCIDTNQRTYREKSSNGVTSTGWTTGLTGYCD